MEMAGALASLTGLRHLNVRSSNRTHALDPQSHAKKVDEGDSVLESRAFSYAQERKTMLRFPS